jgi:hypothetical protein
MVLKAKTVGLFPSQPLVIGKEYKIIDISTPGGHPKPFMDFTNLIIPEGPTYMLDVICDDNFDVDKYRYQHIQMKRVPNKELGFSVNIDGVDYKVRSFWNDYFYSNTETVRQEIRNNKINEVLDLPVGIKRFGG